MASPYLLDNGKREFDAHRELAEPWHFTEWIDRHSQPEAVDQGLATLRRAHPDALAHLDNRLGAAEQLILEQARFREILESLPQTLCHHDAVGANAFSSGPRSVLIIDWESIGAGPVGVDAGIESGQPPRRGSPPHEILPQHWKI